MSLLSVLTAVARRWYVALVVLGLAGYAAFQLWQDAEPQYRSSAVLSVVASPSYLLSQQTDDPAVRMLNPWGQSSSTLASLLADSIAHGAVRMPPELAGTGLVVETSTQRAESFFTVVSVSTSREGAVTALAELQEQAPQVLADIQERGGAPADQQFTAFLARPAVAPAVSYPDRMRLVLGTVLVGLLVTALASVALDGAVRGAASRRASRRGPRHEGRALQAGQDRADSDSRAGAGSRADEGLPSSRPAGTPPTDETPDPPRR